MILMNASRKPEPAAKASTSPSRPSWPKPSSLLTLLSGLHADTLRTLAVLPLAVALGLSLISCRPQQPFQVDAALRKAVADPNSPIKLDEKTGEYVLVFDTIRDGQPSKLKYVLRFSPSSGQPLSSGQTQHSRQPTAEQIRNINERLTSVRTLADAQAALGAAESTLLELAADPHSPVKFDERVSEFQLTFDTVKNDRPASLSMIWRFSPFTGRPLPSRRAGFFMEPAQEDVLMVKQKLYPARTFAEVEAALGPPDESITGDFLGSGFFGSRRIAQHAWTNIAPTLRIVVWELDDGGIDFTYVGKRKEE